VVYTHKGEYGCDECKGKVREMTESEDYLTDEDKFECKEVGDNFYLGTSHNACRIDLTYE